MNLEEITGKTREELEAEGILWIENSVSDVRKYINIEKLIHCKEKEFKNIIKIMISNLHSWISKAKKYDLYLTKNEIKNAENIIKKWVTKEDHRFPLGFALNRLDGSSLGSKKKKMLLKNLNQYMNEINELILWGDEIAALSLDFINFPIIGIGNDIVSDLIANMIIENFEEYTHNKIEKLNISNYKIKNNGLKALLDTNGNEFFLIPYSITTDLKVDWKTIEETSYLYDNLQLISKKIDEIKNKEIQRIKDSLNDKEKEKELKIPIVSSIFRENKDLVKLILNPETIKTYQFHVKFLRFLDENKTSFQQHKIPISKNDGQYILKLFSQYSDLTNKDIKRLMMQLIDDKSAEFIYNQKNNLDEKNLSTFIVSLLTFANKGMVEYEKQWGNGRADIIYKDVVIELKVINKNEYLDIERILISQLRTYMKRFAKDKGMIIIAYQNLNAENLKKIKMALDEFLNTNEDYFLIGFGYEKSPSDASKYEPVTRLLDSSMELGIENVLSTEEYIEYKMTMNEYAKIIGQKKNLPLYELKETLEKVKIERKNLENELKKYISSEELYQYENFTNSKLKKKIEEFKKINILKQEGIIKSQKNFNLENNKTETEE